MNNDPYGKMDISGQASHEPSCCLVSAYVKLLLSIPIPAPSLNCPPKYCSSHFLLILVYLLLPIWISFQSKFNSDYLWVDPSQYYSRKGTYLNMLVGECSITDKGNNTMLG